MSKKENKHSWELSEDEKERVNEVKAQNISQQQNLLNSNKNKEEK